MLLSYVYSSEAKTRRKLGEAKRRRGNQLKPSPALRSGKSVTTSESHKIMRMTREVVIFGALAVVYSSVVYRGR